MKHRCLTDGCNRLVEGQARCPEHLTAQRAPHRTKYQGDWPKISKQAIAQHIVLYGYMCPGHKKPAHPSTDLVLDHASNRVICRGCNSRSRNLGDG